MKGPSLTKRDRVLLQRLFDYGLLSSTQMANWFFPGVEKTTVLRRLRRLEEGEYIRKRGSTPDGTAVFTVDQEGAKSIGQQPKIANYPYHQITHELTLNDVRNRLEGLGVTKSWLPERSIRQELMRLRVVTQDQRFKVVVPDGIALFRHFFTMDAKVKVELELHLKSDVRYRMRFKNFGPMREKPMHFYWYFVRSESAGKRIIKLADDYGDVHANRHIGFTTIDDLMTNGFNAKLVMRESVHLLGEVFGMRRENKNPNPAQAGAQGQSREKGEIEGRTAS